MKPNNREPADPPTAVLVQRPCPQRVTPLGIIVALADDEPIILEGLAADVWEAAQVAGPPATIRRTLLRRYGEDDPELEVAVDAAIGLVRPLLVEASPHTTPALYTAQSAGQAEANSIEPTFGDDPTALLQWLGPQPDAAALLLAAQVTVGRSPATLPSNIGRPPGPLGAFRQRLMPGMFQVFAPTAHPDGPAWQSFEQQEVSVQLHAVRCEQVLLEVLSVLDEVGVDHRVLKGLATAHLDYLSPEIRQIGDVDLLVQPDAHSVVIRLLEQRGYLHITGGDPGSFELYKSNYLIAPNGVELDLHHRLFRHGRRHDDAWKDPEAGRIGNRDFRALPRHWRLLHASIHSRTSTGPARHASGVVDQIRIALRHPGDVERMNETAVMLQLVRFAGLSLENALRVLDVDQVLVAPTSSGLRDNVADWAFGGALRRPLREQVSLLLGQSPADATRWSLAWLRPVDGYRGQRFGSRIRSVIASRSIKP
jgi:hypothetical protein